MVPLGDSGRVAFDAAPVFAGHALSDHAEQAASVLVQPALPVFFFLSAIAVGLAMTIFESSMSVEALWAANLSCRFCRNWDECCDRVVRLWRVAA